MPIHFHRSLLKFLLALTCVCAGWVVLPAQAMSKDYVSARAYWEDPSGQASLEEAQQHSLTPFATF